MKQKRQTQHVQVFFNIVFPNPTEVKVFMFVKSWVFASQRYPFYLRKDGTKLILMGEVHVYLSPDLCNNNKSFLKNISETGEVAIDSNMLSYIRGQLRDSTYTISKIYGFRAGKRYHSLHVKFKDFVFPDFNIEVKLKDKSLADFLKKVFVVSTTLDKFETEIVAPDDIKATLKRQSDYFKQLSEKVYLKSLTHVFGNFFYMI